MLARIVLISWPHDPPTLASQSAGITGLSHRTRPVFLKVYREGTRLSFREKQVFQRSLTGVSQLLNSSLLCCVTCPLFSLTKIGIATEVTLGLLTRVWFRHLEISLLKKI